MDKIIKNQPDWDDTINKNFSKFSNDDFSDNVIYLNGTQKHDNPGGTQLYWRCSTLGEIKLYQIQGYVQFPTLAAGQTIDVFNIPGITGTVHSIMVMLKDGFQDNGIYIDYSSNPGTFHIINYSGKAQQSWTARYGIWVICDN